MTLLATIVRADARRPASWMTLIAAAIAAWEIGGRAGAAAAVASWLCGAALAVAAIGAPIPDPTSPLLRPGAWEGLRVAWPAAGALAGVIAGLAAGAAGRGGDPLTALLLFDAGAVAATLVRRTAAREGESESDAVSLALVLAGTSALAGWAAQASSDLPWLTPAAIAGAWGLQAAALWGIASRAGGTRDTSEGTSPRRAVPVPLLLTSLRRRLIGAAMVASLLGMMGWLFLVPDGAAVDAWVSLGMLASLGAPAATVAGTAEPLRRLLASGTDMARQAAGSSTRRGWRSGVSVVWLSAAVIAWPPIVASALLIRHPTRALAALAIAVSVGLVATLLQLVATRRLPLGTGETRLAAALVLAIAVGLAASR